MYPVFVFCPSTHLEVTEPDDCLLQNADFCDCDRVPVQIRTGSLLGDEPLAQQRRLDDAQHRLTFNEQRQRNRAKGAVPCEVDRAIDRVKHPSRLARALLPTLLFAQERDAGRGLGKRGSDRRLDMQIDIGRKIAVSLADQRTDVGTPLPQNPSADVNGVLGGEKKATGIRIPHTIIVLPATEGHIGTERDQRVG